jgi:hypothetical protein
LSVPRAPALASPATSRTGGLVHRSVVGTDKAAIEKVANALLAKFEKM